MSPTTGTVLLDHVLPRLKATLPRSASPVPGEDAEELLQDATALAARLLHQAEAAHKEVTPGNIAYYTQLHLRSGRRFNSSGSTDVLGARTQLTGRSRMASLDEPMFVAEEASEEPLTLGDVLASDAEDPAHTAARNLDWQSFVATLDERTLAVLRCMADEVRLLELAFERGVGRSTIQGWRNRLTQLAGSGAREPGTDRLPAGPAERVVHRGNLPRAGFLLGIRCLTFQPAFTKKLRVRPTELQLPTLGRVVGLSPVACGPKAGRAAIPC